MPIPKPKPGETQDEFISRCMGNPTMVDEYEQGQRAAICYSAWRRAKGEKVLDWKVFSKIIEKANFTCECLDCGYTMSTDKHCMDVKCPKCGGEMRNVKRPGEGQ